MHQIRSFLSSNARRLVRSSDSSPAHAAAGASLLDSTLRPSAIALLLSLAMVLGAAPVLAQSDADSEMGAKGDGESAEGTTDERSEFPSVYVEYSLGVSVVLAQSLTGADGSGSTLSGRSKQTPGYTFGGALGVKLDEHIRAELRIDYRTSQVDRLAVQGEPNKSKGDLRLLSTMLNGYYDYDLGVGVVPYFGAGIGWGRVELDADNTPGPLQLDVSDTDSVFVWNLMVGGTLPISEVTEISLGYRYVATEDIRIKSLVGGQPRRLDYEFDGHEVLLGLRFNF